MNKECEDVLDSLISYLVIELCGNHTGHNIKPSADAIYDVLVRAIIHYEELNKTGADKVSLLCRRLEPEEALINLSGHRKDFHFVFDHFGDIEWEEFDQVYEGTITRLLGQYNDLLVNASDGETDDKLIVWLREEGLRRGYEVSEDLHHIRMS